MFARMTGIAMVHVPYRGGAPAVLDTVAGQTQLLFSAGTQTLEHVNAGKLTLLAVTESRRAALLPDVPTVADTLPGFEAVDAWALLGPRGLPAELAARLERAAVETARDPAAAARLLADTVVRYVQGTGDPWGTMADVEAMAAATPNALPVVRFPSAGRYEGYRYVNEAVDDVTAFFKAEL
jgi:tripartite-type tricarboxylate transporter receptor subunit TctC